MPGQEAGYLGEHTEMILAFYCLIPQPLEEEVKSDLLYEEEKAVQIYSLI